MIILIQIFHSFIRILLYIYNISIRDLLTGFSRIKVCGKNFNTISETSHVIFQITRTRLSWRRIVSVALIATNLFWVFLQLATAYYLILPVFLVPYYTAGNKSVTLVRIVRCRQTFTWLFPISQAAGDSGC